MAGGKFYDRQAKTAGTPRTRHLRTVSAEMPRLRAASSINSHYGDVAAAIGHYVRS